MARVASTLLVALTLVGSASAVRVLDKAAGSTESSDVTVSDLSRFFQTQLGMPLSSAQSLAQREQGYLTLCGVTVPKLQALKDEMYLRMYVPLSQVSGSILNLAYQQVVPQNLTSFYRALTTAGSPQADAQGTAMGLAIAHADPNTLGFLYQALLRMSVPQSQARQLAVDLTSAGADASVLESSFRTYRYTKGMDQASALNAAVADAVSAYGGGLPKRYANDGIAYPASQFVTFYGSTWLKEWLAGPQEKRTSADGVAYRVLEWQQFFGASWISRYSSAPVAVQYKISADGKTYPLSEFKTFYGQSEWQAQWRQAYEIVDPCSQLDASTCTRQAGCQWRTTADRTFSWCAWPALR